MKTLNKKIHPKQKRPVRVMQIGEGNFLRGFVDYYLQVLNRDTEFDGSVCIVQPRDSHKIGRFNDQDCLFNVITEGLENGETISQYDVIDIVDNVLDPYVEYDRFLDLAKSSDLQVVISNTTESGIRYDDSDIDFSKTPKSYPGKLLAFLKSRYDHFNGSAEAGLYILPCELLSKNGDELQNVLRQLCDLHNFDGDFVEWIFSANKFYNTLVDRIVPGFPADDIEKWQEKWGYVDNLAVKAEVYQLWCIQGDKSLFGVLPFDNTELNVILCDDISPYKERKVKILNGAHTFTVSIAYQLGFTVVNKTVGNERVAKLLNRFIYNEVLPTIDLPKEEIEEFKDSVFDRFANPTIQHLWTAIMLNSMGKFKERVMPSAIQIYQTTGQLPKHALFSMAALFSLYDVRDEAGELVISDEPEYMEMWSTLYDGSHTDEEIVDKALELELWNDDIKNMKGARDFVLASFVKIRECGMDAAVDWILSETE